MINLISPTERRSMKAARTNVVLVHYCLMLIILAILTGLVYGGGFYIVNQEKVALEGKLASQNDQAKAYSQAQKDATAFRKNLTIAKNILNKQTNYSVFLMTLAGDLPSGTVITQLSLGADPKAKSGGTNGTELQARASSYDKVLELKGKLEDSALFENVSILSVTRPDDISKLTGTIALYPYEAKFSVKPTVAPTTSAKTSTGAGS